MSDESKGRPKEVTSHVEDAIRVACSRSFGVLEGSFLCQTVAQLNPKKPICVSENETVKEVLKKLREAKVGCVLIVDEKNALQGIFSERDCILKVIENFSELQSSPISQVMTRDPVREALDTTVAFALNLMSQGGFRHLPLVDPEGVPVGIVSIKDVVDHIVSKMLDDLESFAVESD